MNEFTKYVEDIKSLSKMGYNKLAADIADIGFERWVTKTK